MPIPFLIAAAAAAAVGAAAYAISRDDDKPSGSGRSSDDDDEDAERRLEEAAEKKRKKRERTEKREAASEDFQKQGRAFGKSLVQTLPSDLVQASFAAPPTWPLGVQTLRSDLVLAWSKTTLPSDLVQASLRESVALDFDLKKGSMKFNPEEALQRDAELAAIVTTLNHILTKRASHQKTTENLVTFSELYKPKFQCGVGLKKEKKRMERLDRDIEDLRGIKHQLMKLESELHSTRARASSTP